MRLDDKGDILLESGDIVRFVWQLVGANQSVIDAAIHSLKQTLASDTRINYQGSEIIWVPDESGFDFQCLAIYVQVRKGKTVSQPALASGLAPLVIGAIILVSLVTAMAVVESGVSSWNHNLTIRRSLTTINDILASDASEKWKAEQIQAVKTMTGQATEKPTLTESVQKTAGSLAVVAVIVLIIWAATQMRRASPAASTDSAV